MPDINSEDMKLLVTISNDIEADVTESLLRSYGIPVHRKYRGIGGLLKIYMGISVYGVDFYVSSSHFEKAREILEAHRDKAEENNCDDNEVVDEKE